MNKNYRKYALVALLLSASFALYSQPANVAINTAGATSTNPAILDLSDASNANLGFLMPNVSLLSTTDVTTIVGAATGLIVWNTNATMAGGLGIGFYYWSGSHWLYIMNSGVGGVITGSGTANYMARWTSGTALGTGVVQDNGTGVTISSTALTPVNKLGANGNAAFGSYAGTAAPANGIIVSGQVGIGTSTPNASAALDITSTTQGLLPPRIANPTTITSPATGLVVENSTTGCLELYNGTAWQNISCPCTIATPGSITGSASPTINTSGVYTIASVPGATSYFWSVSTSNGVVTGGQGTTSATITFSNTPGTMNICVYAITGFCNSATSCMSVTSITCAHGTVTFSYVTTAAQTWAVPACITQITVAMWGAGGGGGLMYNGSNYANSLCGGSGAYMQGVLSGLTGQTLVLYVPSGGSTIPYTSAYTYNNSVYSSIGGAGGWPGGGNGGNDYTYGEYGGGGGGYAGLAIGPTYYAVAGAGGGGGSSQYSSYTSSWAGGGGATTGGNASNTTYTGGTGGTTTTGGTGGQGGILAGTAGSSLTGGTGQAATANGEYGGGGGGAGYYGGGGGGDYGDGGGGGSSFPATTYTLGGVTFTVLSNLPGTTNTSTAGTDIAPGSPPPGIGSGTILGAAGNGYITITY